MYCPILAVLPKETPELLNKLGVLVLIIVVAVFVVRLIIRLGGIIMLIIGVVAGSILVMNWTVNRNEPKFLSKFVDVVAPFLPNTGKIQPAKR